MAQRSKSDIEREAAGVELEKLRFECREAEVKAMREEANWADRMAGPDLNHTYYFIDGVSKASAESCIKKLALWAQRDPGCDITIIFNSPGGTVIDGLALYDHIVALRAAGHHVTTVARGYAASMGGILLQAGDERLIGDNAFVLIHEVSKGTIGKLSELEDDIEFTKKLSHRLLDILAERSTLTARQIKNRWDRRDWWLSSDDVLKFGFADRLG